MPGFQTTPRFLLRLIHLPPRLAYSLGLGALIGKFILLLTTTGRKSGQRRVTPLQYEEIGGCYYLGAARGMKSDWVRNIQADQRVELRVKRSHLSGQAEIIQEPGRIADYLEERLRRHPRMVGAILRSEGISLPPRRSVLEQYAGQITLVIVRPEAG